MAVVDVTPLRDSPGFKWLFAGSLFVQGGRQLTVVAVPFQIYQLTGSTLAVGMLGLAQSLAALGRIVGPAWGGFLFDTAGTAMPYLSAAPIMSLALMLAIAGVRRAHLT